MRSFNFLNELSAKEERLPGIKLAFVLSLGLLVFFSSAFAATESKKVPTVPKWGRFEQEFRSSVVYANPLLEARLTVVFTSPLGDSKQVDGFWDGNREWRVRFAPDQAGLWSFKTTCSDKTNRGLHNQTGQFLCTSAGETGRFSLHGPVRVARDHRHFEHADGTPFFWLADTVWSGPRASTQADWDSYATTRAKQNFTVAQWSVSPGEDAQSQTAFTGPANHIAINPEFFKRLDARLATLSGAGILSAISPHLELGSQSAGTTALPDDQALLLVRYIVARWGAEPVVWLLAFDGDSEGELAKRWKQIGEAVFNGTAHPPVLLYPGNTGRLLNEFRDQQWVDAFGFNGVTDLADEALKWSFSGPFAKEWRNLPERPIIAFLPRENALKPKSDRRFAAGEVRSAAYWSLLLTPTAGVSYAARGVADWDTSTDAGLPMWRRAMFMPGAKDMGRLVAFLGSVDFWRLRPVPKLLAMQPGDASPSRFIAASATQKKDLSLVYVPEDRTLDLLLDGLPPSPVIKWFNPRTGQSSSAVAIITGRTCQFPTPDTGDWLLTIKAGS